MITLYYTKSFYGNMSKSESKQFRSVSNMIEWIKQLDTSFNCQRIQMNLNGEYIYIYIQVGVRAVLGDISRYTIDRIETEEGVLFDEKLKHCSQAIREAFDEIKGIGKKEKVLIP